VIRKCNAPRQSPGHAMCTIRTPRDLGFNVRVPIQDRLIAALRR
jgi:hypothetical protein